jgi:hypothetical protein
MSFFKRIFATDKRSSAPPAPSVPESARAREAQDPPIEEAARIQDILQTEETRSAEFYAGDLFRRRFGSEPPDYPRHFIAFYRAGRRTFWPIGYIHYSVFEDTFLCGGMVVDDRLYRRIPDPHRKLIKDAGGIAERMLRETFSILAHAPAIWGYVGDKQAEQVDMRVGFRHTDHPHVMVVWNHDLPESEKAARLQRVIALGPF